MKEVSSFQGLFYTLFYVTETMYGVLMKGDVLISGVSLHIECYVPLYIPYSGKLLHGANFVVFADEPTTAKIKPAEIFNSPVGTALCRVLSQK